jgi:hypothetical protein
MEVSTNNQSLSKVEAVVSSINENFIELQMTGSYESLRWPRQELQRSINVGEKILLELKNHPITGIQKTIEKAKQENKDPFEQRKLLENLIN